MKELLVMAGNITLALDGVFDELLGMANTGWGWFIIIGIVVIIALAGVFWLAAVIAPADNKAHWMGRVKTCLWGLPIFIFIVLAVSLLPSVLVGWIEENGGGLLG